MQLACTCNQPFHVWHVSHMWPLQHWIYQTPWIMDDEAELYKWSQNLMSLLIIMKDNFSSGQDDATKNYIFSCTGIKSIDMVDSAVLIIVDNTTKISLKWNWLKIYVLNLINYILFSKNKITYKLQFRKCNKLNHILKIK